MGILYPPQYLVAVEILLFLDGDFILYLHLLADSVSDATEDLSGYFFNKGLCLDFRECEVLDEHLGDPGAGDEPEKREEGDVMEPPGLLDVQPVALPYLEDLVRDEGTGERFLELRRKRCNRLFYLFVGVCHVI